MLPQLPYHVALTEWWCLARGHVKSGLSSAHSPWRTMEVKQSTQVTQHYTQAVPIPFFWELVSFFLFLDFAPFPARYSLLKYPSGSPEVSVLSPCQKAISLCASLTPSLCSLCLYMCHVARGCQTSSLMLGADCMEELRKLSLKAVSKSAAGDKEVKGKGRRQRSKTQIKSRLWQRGK